MTRRVAVAAALVVLSLLVGTRWVTTRTAPVAQAQQPPPSTPSPTPSPSPTRVTPSPVAPPKKTVAAPKPKPNRGRGGPYGSVRMTGKKAVALTFDDGPHPVWTPQVLDRLRASKVKATFCLVGTQVRRHPGLVRRIVREGHTLCNHTWNHELDLGTKPPAKIRANLEATNRAIREAVPDTEIKFFRHPGGKWTASAVEVAGSLGMTSLDWDVDPRDWETKDAKLIQTRILGNARPGSIILMHDGGGDRHGTLVACPKVIATLKSRYGITLLR